eukprot:gene4561-4999_t
MGGVLVVEAVSLLSYDDPSSILGTLHLSYVNQSQLPHQVAFFGDSITYAYQAHHIWEVEFEHLPSFNFGVRGDRWEGLLWRLQHGELSSHPTVCVVSIGTNNLSPSNPHYQEVYEGIVKVVSEIHRQRGNVSIVLMGLFPRDRPSHPLRSTIKEVNTHLSEYYQNASNVRFLDIGAQLVNNDENEEFLPGVILPDLIHLKTRGYAIWTRALKPIITELLTKSSSTTTSGRTKNSKSSKSWF